VNTSFLSIVKRIITGYGEGILADPQRLKAFFSDLAKDEPKPLRIAFGRCIEAGAYTALKNTPDQSERVERKYAIAQRLRDEYGLDPDLCAEALDILEAALFVDRKGPSRCAKCGGELREEWKLCPFCGAAIGAKQTEAPVTLPILDITPESPAEEEQIPNDVSNAESTASNVGIGIGIGGAIGAIVGAIVGAGIGDAIGIGIGGAIGIVTGAIIGAVIGAVIDGRKRSKP
jgi:hypothetical protein